ncbi:MAG: hypothetical protein ACOWYE_08295 [Desulfatiglandales bacterium]
MKANSEKSVILDKKQKEVYEFPSVFPDQDFLIATEERYFIRIFLNLGNFSALLFDLSRSSMETKDTLSTFSGRDTPPFQSGQKQVRPHRVLPFLGGHDG